MRPDAKYHDEPCSMPFQWSISRVLTINREKLLCRNAQTANWYLRLNVLGYRYKKKGLCPCAQHEKIWKIHDYNWAKCHFHACARHGYVPINVYFIVVLIIHRNFVLQNDSYKISFKKKITTKNTENMLFFAVFWKWLKI